MTQFDNHFPLRSEISPKNLVLLVIVVVLCGVVFVLRQVALLGLAAIVIAVVLSDAANFVKRRTGLSRSKAFCLALIMILCGAVTILWIFGAQIADQVRELATKLPSAIGTVQRQFNSNPAEQAIVAAIAKQLEGAGSSIAGLAARAGGFAFGFLGVMIQGLVVVSAGIFLASEPKPYRGSILRLLAKPQRRLTKAIFDRSGLSVSRWAGGTLISMAITASLVLVCLLAFGVPAPIALALLAGLSQIVPVIGPVASAAVGVILAASVSFEVAALVALAYFVISQVEANVITPNILKKAVKVPPALVLFSILAMGTLFGSLGVVLAIPALLVLNDIIEVLRQPVKVNL